MLWTNSSGDRRVREDRLAVAPQGREVQLFGVEDETKWTIPEASAGGPVKFHPNADRIAVTAPSGELLVCDVASENASDPQRLYVGSVSDFEWSADGQS